MPFFVQTKINEVLTPYRKNGILPKNLKSDARNAITDSITKILVEHFKGLDSEVAKKQYSKWAAYCHTDRGDIKADFVFNGEIIITAALMNEINHLSTSDPKQHTSSNTGVFFTLLEQSFKKSQPEVKVVCDELSFSQWYMNFLENVQFFEAKGTQVQLKDFDSLICVKAEDNQYYVGPLANWFEYNIQKQIHAVLGYYPASQKQDIRTTLKTVLTSGLFPLDSDFLNEIKDEEPVPLPLLPLEEAFFEFHVQTAEDELDKSIEGGILVRFATNQQGNPVKVSNYRKYYESQLYVTLWHLLYAAPTDMENFNHPGEIKTFATKERTQAQYNTLRALFLTPNERFTAINLKVFPKGNWNWLLEALDWMYANGKDAAVAFPWKVYSQNGHLRLENYEEAKRRKIWDRLYTEISTYLPNITLAKMASTNTLLFLPLIFGAALYGFYAGPFLWSNFAAGFIIAPICLSLLVQAVTVCHSVFEPLLQKMAQFNKPFSLNTPSWVPTPIKEYYGQIIAPLWRIIAKPYDGYYTNQNTLRNFYPLRAGLGIGLAALATLSFLAEQIVFQASKWAILGAIGLCNLPFAMVYHTINLPSYIASIPSWFKETVGFGKTSHPTKILEPFPLSPKQPTLLLCGPIGKPAAKALQSGPVGKPTTNPLQEEVVQPNCCCDNKPKC